MCLPTHRRSFSRPSPCLLFHPPFLYPTCLLSLSYAAHKEGKIQIGFKVLSVNGEDCSGISKAEVAELLLSKATDQVDILFQPPY